MTKFQFTGIILGIFVLASFSSQSFAQDTGQSPILTLKVSVLSPHDGSVLTHFPTKLEVKVTSGDLPIEGARVQFWMQGGLHDAAMHNAFLTSSDSSGYAYLTLLNPNTLDEGQYIWYASAIQPSFKGAVSQVISFYNSYSSNKENISGGMVSTDQKEYSIAQSNVISIKIHGNVNNYHLGQPIILKIIQPDGKIYQLVEYGTYLGTFQTVYNLGQNSKLGSYKIVVYHNLMSSTNIFHVVK